MQLVQICKLNPGGELFLICIIYPKVPPIKKDSVGLSVCGYRHCSGSSLVADSVLSVCF